jgi:hypothetical protein
MQEHRDHRRRSAVRTSSGIGIGGGFGRRFVFVMKRFGFFALLTFTTIAARAAVTFRLEDLVEGSRPRHASSRVLVDGSHWRIDHEGPALFASATIGDSDHDAIAINDSNQTWYSLKHRAGIVIGSDLFSYGFGAAVSKIRVAFADAAKTRITYSYEIEIKVGTEKVPGRVWGEIRVWTRAEAVALPWNPMAIATGHAEVDSALQSQLAQIQGFVWKSEVEVSRRFDSGETLHQVITRTIGEFAPATAKPGDFKVPDGYREQAPVIGVPGK